MQFRMKPVSNLSNSFNMMRLKPYKLEEGVCLWTGQIDQPNFSSISFNIDDDGMWEHAWRLIGQKPPIAKMPKSLMVCFMAHADKRFDTTLEIHEVVVRNRDLVYQFGYKFAQKQGPDHKAGFALMTVPKGMIVSAFNRNTLPFTELHRQSPQDIIRRLDNFSKKP